MRTLWKRLSSWMRDSVAPDWPATSPDVDASVMRQHFQEATGHGIMTVAYDSSQGLQQALARLDLPGTFDLTALIVLHASFAGHLPTCIRRRYPAAQLILTTVGTRLPGHVTIGQLCACEQSLGWSRIVFSSQADQALAEVLRSHQPEQCLVLCHPFGNLSRVEPAQAAVVPLQS